jgi:hypothetical protein
VRWQCRRFAVVWRNLGCQVWPVSVRGGGKRAGERVQREVRVEGRHLSIKKYWFKFIDSGLFPTLLPGLAHFSAILTPLSMRRPPQVPCPCPSPKTDRRTKRRGKRVHRQRAPAPSVCNLKAKKPFLSSGFPCPGHCIRRDVAPSPDAPHSATFPTRPTWNVCPTLWWKLVAHLPNWRCLALIPG